MSVSPSPLILVLTVVLISCSSPPSEETTKPSFPDTARELLDRLNAWHKDEIDAYERPSNYPNFDASGETVGYIEECKERLKGLGCDVKWNPNKRRYDLIAKQQE